MPTRKLFYPKITISKPLHAALTLARSEGCEIKWRVCPNETDAETVLVVPLDSMREGSWLALVKVLEGAGFTKVPAQRVYGWCSCKQLVIAV